MIPRRLQLVLFYTAIFGGGLAFGAPASPLEGRWTAEQANSDGGPAQEAVLTFTEAGGVLRGSMHLVNEDMPLFDVRETGMTVSFTLVIPGAPYVTVHYAGARTVDEIRMVSADEGRGVFTLTAHREESLPVPPQPAPLPAPPLEPAPRVATAPPAIVAAPAPAPMPAPPQMASLALPLAAPAAGPPLKLPLPALHDVPPANVAKTPPMGWASRQKLGTDIDDEAIRQAADGLNETHLREAGYVYLEVNEGWQGARDISGGLHGNAKFPDMKGLGDYIHAKGLKFGLQTSAAPKSCNGFEGSYGHEDEDAKTFAAWGVDYLVYDWCGAEAIYATQAEQQAAYQKMGEALRASGRDIAFGISQNGAFNVAQWAAKTGANLWRNAHDIEDNWQSMTEAGFSQNGKEVFAGPSHWNDPGLIQLGNGGMTPDEYRFQLNLWALLAAPMMLGNEVRIMTRDTVALLTNAEVIAVDQDSAGRQAKRVAQNGETEVWARALADGSMAVGFFNRGNQSAAVAATWQQLGIEGPRRARDLWWHKDLGAQNGRYAVFLTPHTSLLLRMSR